MKCQSRLTGLLLAVCVLLLAGCAGQNTTPSAAQIAGTEGSAEQWLDLAARSQGRQAAEARLKAGQILAQLNRDQEALDILSKIQWRMLTMDDRWLLIHLGTQTALNLEDGWQALMMIDEISPSLMQLDRDQQTQLQIARAHAYELIGLHEAAAREYFAVSQLQRNNPSAQTETRKAIWRNLQALSPDTLKMLANQEKIATLRGWFELAEIRQTANDNLVNLDQQLTSWFRRWPDHPAREELPKDLALLRQLSENPVAQVAVFLPSSGPLAGPAQVLRDALMARHYQRLAAGQPVLKMHFYDTQSTSLDDLYDRAEDDGANVVIGPLAKGLVSELEQWRSVPLPTLALNYGTEKNNETDGLMEFGLSAENEAQQVAEQAWQNGLRRALVLTPNSSWGQRVADSFTQVWTQMGGSIARQATFGDGQNVDKALRSLLEVNLSEERKRQLVKTLGLGMHFEPRARQDADFLFLHARPGTARQVTPALAYLKANHLPVLATSAVFDGQIDPKQDRDMDGIAFCDIPWYLENRDNPLRQKLAELWPGNMHSYGRLYAMGADAYTLAERLPLLEALPESQIEGATGRLTQTHQRIMRHLQWARFEEGRPRPLSPEDIHAQQGLAEQLIPDE
ncbi:hypothetical protein BFW38_03160 [Terasakiispira papahanaumokuakeensis]|uniref:Penicillin-binding protein activator n=1 Tax=Terasakiispira papahanaumokuakeensis TaxID=197479 RepID=A0A1E2V765_9GAMM|nr:penicillin-binding protein activator [Terasakiispira papahanaumokuakeensis]ODC02692.1 hypothetical protein BFW38_03160 [Terasakiispira papahanaumokuakeensis]